MTDRKGLWTPNQEKGIDDLIEFEGIKEKFDGIAIRLLDNQVIDRLLKKIPEEYRPLVYEMSDEILAAFGIEK